MILFSTGLVVLACLFPAPTQEGKYDAVNESLLDNPAPPDDRLKTTASEPIADEALSLHPDVDTRNADDIATAISDRDEMPPVLSLPSGS